MPEADAFSYPGTLALFHGLLAGLVKKKTSPCAA